MSKKPDIELEPNLKEYLETSHGIAREDVMKTQILRGGVSNKTVQVFFNNGDSWVLKQALDKLRVQGDWFSHPDRIYREAEAMRWFEENLPEYRIPRIRFEDKQNHIMGMEAVLEPFKNFKSYLLHENFENKYFTQAGSILGVIHEQGYNSGKKLPTMFLDKHFFHSLRINPYYEETSKSIPEVATFMNHLIEETDINNFTLTHGDYSPKNLLIKDGELVLLDHEVIHFGDGTFDLGFFISHLLSKANHLPEKRNKFYEGVNLFFDEYAKKSKLIDSEREFRAVRHAIACLLARVAGMSKLEYLTVQEQNSQVEICKALVHHTPETINDLIDQFTSQLANEN